MRQNRIYECDVTNSCKLPFFDIRVQAGLPSIADSTSFIKLDINKHLIKNPASTFFVEVRGESMINAGIKENDILVVDKFKAPRSNNIVIAVINSKFSIRRLLVKDDRMFLIAENTDSVFLEVKENTYICGVVTSIVKKL